MSDTITREQPVTAVPIKRKSPKPRVDRICLVCEKEFTVIAYRVDKGRGIYCSRKCSASHHENKIEITCEHCGKKLKRRRDRITDKPFCSHKCRNAYEKGPLNPRWRGGKRGIRATVEYKEWRVAILKAGDFTCEKCGVRGGRLETHHILSFVKYPEAALSLDNGAILCKSCHKEFHHLYGTRRFTDEDYFKWLRE